MNRYIEKISSMLTTSDEKDRRRCWMQKLGERGMRRWHAFITDPTRAHKVTKLTLRMRFYLWRHCRALPDKQHVVRGLRMRLAAMMKQETQADNRELAEVLNLRERKLIYGIMSCIFYVPWTGPDPLGGIE